LAQTDPSNLLVCGTNSFNPKCRTYSSIDEKEENEKEEFKVKHEFSGKGFCPYDPKHNSTAIFTGE
jgi:semaphorin 6